MTVTLEQIVREIKEQTKMVSVSGGDDVVDPSDYVSTGNMALDWCLDGQGFAFGFIVQLLGMSRSGKTALMMKTAASAQEKYDAFVLWGDREGAFTRAFAEKLGMDMSKVILVSPSDIPTPKEGFHFFRTARKAVRETYPDKHIVMCLDSLAAFSVGQEGEDMGKVAKMNHRGFRDLIPSIDNKTMVIFANQVTYKIGVLFGKKTTHTGGTAPEYYSSYILELDGGRLIKNERGGIVGQNITAEVAKTRLGPARRGTIIPFYYTHGYAYYDGLFRVLVSQGILEPTNKADYKAGKPTRYRHCETKKIYLEGDAEVLLTDHPNIGETGGEMVFAEEEDSGD